MPFDPKRPPNRRPGAPPSPAAKQEDELPFKEGEVTPLRADDPRPQRVPQYPAMRRKAPRKIVEEGTATEVLDKDDLELAASYDASRGSEPGHTPAFLYVERGPGAGQLVPVKQGLLVIGRASSCELRIQHPSISRRHALLNRKGERFFLKDLGSQNGTFVHKDKLTAEREIFPGDQVAVGNTVLKLRGPREANEPLETSAVGAPGPGGHSGLRIALFTAAAFIGLAGALAFALATLNKAPTFEPVAEAPPLAPAPPPLAAAAPATLEEAPPPRAAPAPVQVAPPVEVEVPSEPAQPIAQATEPERQPPRRSPAPKPSRAVARPAPAPAPAPARKVAMVVREELPDEDPEPAPPPAAAPARDPVAPRSRAAILAAYSSGNVGNALRLARSARAAELEAQLTRFQQSYASAHQALSARKEEAALTHFGAALELDGQLSSEPSTYGVEIRRQLSSLHTLAGFRALDAEDVSGARRAFTSALRFDPGNARARKQLTALGGGDPAPAKAAPARPAPARASIDDAFGDEAPPAARAIPASAAPPPAKKKAEPKPSAKSSIDAAFGDE